MKKFALIGVMSLALIGCSATPSSVDWQANNQVVMNQAEITLKSSLWLNKMPMISDSAEESKEQASKLHGALYLESAIAFSSDLDVFVVALKQGEQEWTLTKEAFEIRRHSDKAWEVSFKWDAKLDATEKVNIAVGLQQGESTQWLVDQNINVDKVY